MPPQPDNVPCTSNKKASEPNASTSEMNPNISAQELLHLLVGMITNKKITNNVVQDKSKEESSLKRKAPEGEAKESENRSSELLEVVEVLEPVTRLSDVPSTSNDTPKKDLPMNLDDSDFQKPPMLQSLVKDKPSDSMGSTHSLAGFSRNPSTSNTRATNEASSNESPKGEAKELEKRSRELLEVIEVLKLITKFSGVPSTLDDIPRRDLPMNLNPTHQAPPSLVMDTSSDSIGSAHSSAGNPSTSNTKAERPVRHPAPQEESSNGQASKVPPCATPVGSLKGIVLPPGLLRHPAAPQVRPSKGPVQPVPPMNLPSSAVATPVNNKTEESSSLSLQEARLEKLIEPIHDDSIVLPTLSLNTVQQLVNDWVIKSKVDTRLFAEKVLKTPTHTFEKFMRSYNKLKDTLDCYEKLLKFINLKREVKEEILNLLAMMKKRLPKNEKRNSVMTSEEILERLYRDCPKEVVERERREHAEKQRMKEMLKAQKEYKKQHPYTLPKPVYHVNSSSNLNTRQYQSSPKMEPSSPKNWTHVLRLKTQETMNQHQKWAESNDVTVEDFAEHILECTPKEYIQSMVDAILGDHNSIQYVKCKKFLALPEVAKKQYAVKLKAILADAGKTEVNETSENLLWIKTIGQPLIGSSAPETQKIHHTPAPHQSSFTNHPHQPSTSNTRAGSAIGPTPQLPSNSQAHWGSSHVGPHFAKAPVQNRKKNTILLSLFEHSLMELIAPIHDDSAVSNTVSMQVITQLVDKWIEKNKVNLELFVKKVLKTAIDVFNRCKKHGNRLTGTDDCYKKMVKFMSLSFEKRQEIREILEEIRKEEERALLEDINPAQPIHRPIAPTPIFPQRPPTQHHPDASSELKSLLVPIYTTTPIPQSMNVTRIYDRIMMYLVNKNIEKEVFVEIVLIYDMKEGEDISDCYYWRDMTPTQRNQYIKMSKFLNLPVKTTDRVAVLLKKFRKPKTEERPWRLLVCTNEALSDVNRTARPQIPKPVSPPIPKKRQCQPDHIEKREALRNDQGSSSTSQLEGPNTSTATSSQEKSLELLRQFVQPPNEPPIPDDFKPNMALLAQEFMLRIQQTEHGINFWRSVYIYFTTFFLNTALTSWERLSENGKLYYWRIRLFLDFEKEQNKIEEQKPTSSSRGTSHQSHQFTEHQNQRLMQIYSTSTTMPNKEKAEEIAKELKLSPASVIMWFEVIQKAMSNMIKP